MGTRRAVATELKDRDRRIVGEIYIGHVLAFAPSGSDGVWPAIEVRDLLENVQSGHIEEGLRTQLFNRRGVTSRDAEEGGQQERALAQKYTAEAERLVDRWPRTAAVLRALAAMYGAVGRREETDAERRRRGLD